MSADLTIKIVEGATDGQAPTPPVTPIPVPAAPAAGSPAGGSSGVNSEEVKQLREALNTLRDASRQIASLGVQIGDALVHPSFERLTRVFETLFQALIGGTLEKQLAVAIQREFQKTLGLDKAMAETKADAQTAAGPTLEMPTTETVGGPELEIPIGETAGTAAGAAAGAAAGSTLEIPAAEESDRPEIEIPMDEAAGSAVGAAAGTAAGTGTAAGAGAGAAAGAAAGSASSIASAALRAIASPAGLAVVALGTVAVAGIAAGAVIKKWSDGLEKSIVELAQYSGILSAQRGLQSFEMTMLEMERLRRLEDPLSRMQLRSDRLERLQYEAATEFYALGAKFFDIVEPYLDSGVDTLAILVELLKFATEHLEIIMRIMEAGAEAVGGNYARGILTGLKVIMQRFLNAEFDDEPKANNLRQIMVDILGGVE